MKLLRCYIVAFGLTAMCAGQTATPVSTQAVSALLPGAEAVQLAKRIVELMDSTGAALPELQLATAPLVAGAKNTLASLEKQSGDATVTAHFARQTQAFLSVADVTPKPFPFSETARKQLAELRDDEDRLESHLAALIDRVQFQTHDPDRDNLKRYAEENSRVSPPGAAARVVFLGDSITDFWHLNEYFTGRDFINRGISGQVTGQMLGRFKADVIDLRPKAVLILAGTNDISRGTTLDVIENNILMMSELARVHQIKVVIASVLPTSQQQTTRPIHTIQLLNAWLQNYCTQSGATYLDYFSKMREPSGFLQPELSDDGLHPNSRGYRVMAPLAQAAIDHALGAAAEIPSDAAHRRRVRVF